MRYRLLAALFCCLPSSLCLAQGAPPPPAAAEAPAAASGNGSVTPEEMRRRTRDQTDAMAARLAKGGGTDDEWLLLARSYLMFEDFDKAKDAANHLIELHPKAIEPRLVLAEAQLSGAPHGKGLPTDFVATMRKILAMDAKNPGRPFMSARRRPSPGMARKPASSGPGCSASCRRMIPGGRTWSLASKACRRIDGKAVIARSAATRRSGTSWTASRRASLAVAVTVKFSSRVGRPLGR